MSVRNDHLKAARQIIVSLGLPRAQQNERSALCLLALLNLSPGKAWAAAENPLMGITPWLPVTPENASRSAFR